MIDMESYVHIDGWKANIRFSAAHLIHGHTKCGRLHGHTYAVHVTVYGDQDKNGMIVDFSYLKKVLKEIVEKFDHKVLLADDDTHTSVQGEDIVVTVDEHRYVFPKNDCVLLPMTSVTVEHLAEYVGTLVVEKLKSLTHVTRIDLGVDEGPGQGARCIRNLR